MHQLASGLRDVGRGLDVLRAHPTLWKWVVAPAVVSLVLLVALVAGVMHLVDPFTGWLVAHLPGWLAHIASSLLTVLVVIALSVGALIAFVSVAGIIAGPFHEMLSEHVEAKLTGEPPAPFALSTFLHGAALGVIHGLRRLAVSLIGLAVAFAVGFVPVIGTVAALVLGGWLAATSAAYDCYDAVLARRSLAYRDKLAYLARHRGRTLGLGAAVAAMLLVPGLNLIALGLGAAGATVAALAQDRPDLTASSKDRR